VVLAVGFLNEAQMHAFKNKSVADVRILGTEIKDIVACPHHPLAVNEKIAHILQIP